MKRTMTTLAAFVCCVMMMANPVVPAFLIFLEYSKKVSIFAFGMITRQECIDTIKANAETIVQQFDVRSLRLFGSLARNEQRESSDVDVCVEMPPDMFQLIGLKQYLEELMGCDVTHTPQYR